MKQTAKSNTMNNNIYNIFGVVKRDTEHNVIQANLFVPNFEPLSADNAPTSVGVPLINNLGEIRVLGAGSGIALSLPDGDDVVEITNTGIDSISAASSAGVIARAALSNSCDSWTIFR